MGCSCRTGGVPAHRGLIRSTRLLLGATRRAARRGPSRADRPPADRLAACSPPATCPSPPVRATGGFPLLLLSALPAWRCPLAASSTSSRRASAAAARLRPRRLWGAAAFVIVTSLGGSPAGPLPRPVLSMLLAASAALLASTLLLRHRARIADRRRPHQRKGAAPGQPRFRPPSPACGKPLMLYAFSRALAGIVSPESSMDGCGRGASSSRSACSR